MESNPEKASTDEEVNQKEEDHSPSTPSRKREHKSGKSSKSSTKKPKHNNPLKRILVELQDIILEPPFGILAAPKESNMFFLTHFISDSFEWEAKLTGPEESPYAGGIFFLDIHFPDEYPFQPPKITFRTRIYHCNINSNGVICLDIIKNNWSPALTISKVLLSIMQLLSEPNPADPLVKPIAYEMLNAPEQYFKAAQEWTKKYASPQLLGDKTDSSS